MMIAARAELVHNTGVWHGCTLRSTRGSSTPMTTTRTRVAYLPDLLDRKLFAAFPGLVMRKDLTQAIRGTSKAPSYVIEFMLGKYCANLFDDEEVREGLQLVQQEVAEYIPRGDETEVIKSAIRERPPRRIIDLVKVELDEGLGSGVYWANLITANIQDVRIATDIVTKYDRLLMAGAWCNIRVDYDDTFKVG